MKLTRRQILQATGGAVVVGLAGCGPGGTDETDDPAQGQSCSFAGASAITGNHGHSVTLPRATLEAGADGSFEIRGTADHSHALTLTGAQLSALLAGETLTLDASTTLEHSHSVTLRCGGRLPGEDPGGGDLDPDYGGR